MSGVPPGTRPRVLILTARHWYRHLSHTIVLDFEDAMASVAAVDWHHLPADAMSSRPIVTRSVAGAERDEPYDLALFVAMAPSWLRALRGVRGLRRAARQLAVYVFDAWPYQLRSLMRWRRQVAWIDHLFVAYPEAVAVYGPRLRCPVHYLVQGTSPERFRPDRPERPIDLLSIGRREPTAHRRLVELAAAEDLLYVFADRTVPVAFDLDDSRLLTGSLARSANAQVSWAVEATDPARAGGYSPVTARWFEAAACASVALGRRPRSATFDDLFPYERFVVDLDPTGDGFAATVERALRLDDRAARLELAARVRSEHSWRRRCESILETVI